MAGLAVVPLLVTASPGRKVVDLRTWQFSRDSVHWQTVDVPHDWAIAGPFDKKWDLQNVAIVQNGEKEKSEKSGRSGALPWLGRGFYSTTLTVDKQPECRYLLEFDGAMSEPHVYVNGHLAGWWAYGYNAFRLDIGPLLHAGDNQLVVTLRNEEQSSVRYPGAGLYRPVRLVMVPPVYIDTWGTYCRTVSADSAQAMLTVDTQLRGYGGQDGLAVEVGILGRMGEVTRAEHVSVDSDGHARCNLLLKAPRLWSPEHPNLYTLVTTLYQYGKQIDRTMLRTGVRTISVDAEHGFRLNGVSRKFKGVCLHHDLGPLGVAVNKAALIRQVKMLKDMGADAIRTSHNMPSQMQMEVYDSLGMMVMAESFDMWKYPKCKNGYARFFDQWADSDITNLVLANRNHPSCVMWSIGNEIPEQGSANGPAIARHLQDICHRLDPSRPVTQGMDRADAALKTGFAQVMDVPGFNYRVHKYASSIGRLPQGFLLGSETASTVSSRGVYKFPVKFQVATDYPDGQCSGYDTEWCPWSNLPEEDFMAQEDRSYTIGQFVWTGYDYLGEPTPYDTYWPSRSSYFGIMDLAGLPKDRFYLYRSVWNKKSHTLHILPHWTWPGREGKVTPVFVYTDWPQAELFVNGKSQGRRSKALQTRDNTTTALSPAMAEGYARRYRLMWDSVRYEPGELRVVAYDLKGQPVGEQTVLTAGKPVGIKLECDRTGLTANGDDLAYITVSLVDSKGTELPVASDRIDVEVEGHGRLRALCNGDATSLESFVQPHMKLFSGKLVAVVQAGFEPGSITVRVIDASRRLTAQTVLEVVR